MNPMTPARNALAKAAAGVIRWRWAVWILFLLFLYYCFGGLRLIRFDVSNESWFLDGDPMQVAEDRFESIFGNNDYAAILYEADNVFDPVHLHQIRQIGQALMAKVPHADEVRSLADLEFTRGTADGLTVGQLIPDPIPTDPTALALIREQAMAKPTIKNRLVSEDGRQTWILLRLKPYPDPTEKLPPDIATGRAVLQVIRELNPKNAKVTPTGFPVINTQKKQFFTREMRRNLKLSMGVALIVLAVSIRSIPGTIFPAVFTVASVIMVMGLQGRLGIKMDPSVLLVPVYLALAVGVAYAIHLFAFFNRIFAATGKRTESLVEAVREVGWPIAFTAFTTIGAMLTFIAVPVRQIRWIGGTAAALVTVTFFMVMTLIPAVLSIGRDRKPKPVQTRQNSRIEAGLERLGTWVLAHPAPILISFTLVSLIALAGLPKFQAGFDVRKSFGLKIPYVAAMDHVGRSQIGSIYAYDLLIEFPETGPAKTPEMLTRLETLAAAAGDQALTKRTSSILEVLKDLNQSVHDGDPACYTLPTSPEMVAQLLLLYENAGGIEAERWIDYDYQRLRLMVELDDYNSVEINRELETLKAEASRLFPTASIGFVGTIAQFSVMQKYVYTGQLVSFALATLVITLLMILVFGSIKTGLIGMIPNITPALVMGGIMGWADIPLNIMTITIMPMLLGLAVDDTIHFIVHAGRAVAETGSYQKGIVRTFGAIGLPLALTSGVIIANFAVYTTSIAKAYIQIGVLAGAGILSALLTDFLVTPILIDRFRPFGHAARDTAETPPARYAHESGLR